MKQWLQRLRDFFDFTPLNHFKTARPGQPLVALAYVLITHGESPWEVRLDLPQQLLATGLTWYWQTFPGPLQELTPLSIPHMMDDLRAYLSGRRHSTVPFMIYGCLVPVTLRLPEDGEDFKARLRGPIRVWIEQVGDWQQDALWVAPEVLPRLRGLLESWGFKFD